MNSLKTGLEALQRSRAGLFVRKVLDDQAPNLAALLAWGTLSAMLPLMLGILGIAGLVLRDQERLDKVYNLVFSIAPGQASGPLGEALDNVRRSSAEAAGIVAIGLLVFNGSAFFANMASVFDQAYHVDSRNFVMQRIVAIVMLITTTVLIVVSTFTLGLGDVVDTLPFALPMGPLVARVITWSISILSAILLFLLLFKVLPNAEQGWRDVLPGTLLSTVLFFVILQVFPFYLSISPPNQTYAVFGVFLVFTFWLYLLGWVFVLGAELNAFMQEPARSSALAEATRKAQRGHAQYEPEGSAVEAEATGSAPAVSGGGVLGSPKRSAHAQAAEQGQSTGGGERAAQPQTGNRPSFGGRILGFIGLVIAAFLLRGRSPEEQHQTAN